MLLFVLCVLFFVRFVFLTVRLSVRPPYYCKNNERICRKRVSGQGTVDGMIQITSRAKDKSTTF